MTLESNGLSQDLKLPFRKTKDVLISVQNDLKEKRKL